MTIDCHVHVSACVPGHGSMSKQLLHSLRFRVMRWKFGLLGYDEATELALEKLLATTIDGSGLDAAVVLAFDAVHDQDGRLDEQNTHLYVTNDYAIDLCFRHHHMLFGASVHPYRKDAVAEVERCIAAGAVLLKWLPLVQGFNPADPRCFPIYEALAHHKVPLLSHTGGEKTLPIIDPSVASPALLEPALQRGVTVIAAHCGTRSALGETDYLNLFMQMAREHEHFYGDTSALTLPQRSHGLLAVLRDPVVSQKVIHGSDWPIPALPLFMDMHLSDSWNMLHQRNWMRRDVLIKKKLGFDDAYWNRAEKVLRLT